MNSQETSLIKSMRTELDELKTTVAALVMQVEKNYGARQTFSIESSSSGFQAGRDIIIINLPDNDRSI